MRIENRKFVSMNHLTKILFIALLSFSSAAMGQEDFADLSSKKRISIAEQEELDAKNDDAFQQMMMDGHDLFKKKHYLKAIRAYEKAQDKRPYNVYPKVIISDIELSMKDTLVTLRKAENLEKKELPKPEVKPETPEPVKEETPKDDRMEKLNEWERKERERMARERAAKEKEENKPDPVLKQGDVPIASLEDFQKDLANNYPSGITEKVTTEGNRTITTRIVVADGKGDEYKKVVHNWGGVFYFKNSEAVTERVWKLETEK